MYLEASGMFQALGGMRVASEGLLGARGPSRLDMTWVVPSCDLGKLQFLKICSADFQNSIEKSINRTYFQNVRAMQKHPNYTWLYMLSISLAYSLHCD
jgi:hypothetical protein